MCARARGAGDGDGGLRRPGERASGGQALQAGRRCARRRKRSTRRARSSRRAIGSSAPSAPEYNLAVCYELSHKAASARRKYLEAAGVRAAVRQGLDRERGDGAREEARPRRPASRAPHGPAERPPGTTVRCDGRVLDPEAWKKPIELDPGAHRVVVMADGSATFDKVVNLIESETTDLQVVFTPLAGGAAPSVVAAPAKPEDPGADQASTSGAPFPWKWVGLGAAAVGVVGMGVGGYFALHAKSERDNSGCANGRTCPTRPPRIACAARRATPISRPSSSSRAVSSPSVAVSSSSSLLRRRPPRRPKAFT